MPETMPVLGVPRLAGANESADLVVRNARVFTNDPHRPDATCVAVRSGRITVVGGEADVDGVIGASTRVIDALGRRVIPGLNDSHLHVIRGGLHYLLELRWDGVPVTRARPFDAARTSRAHPKGQWVRVVGGWTGDQFAERRIPTSGAQCGRARHAGLRAAPLPVGNVESRRARKRWAIPRTRPTRRR